MKIVLASALYPPDIAEPASYVKELAKRLSATHEVVVVAYGRLPEQVPGARIVAIDKRRPLPLRLLSYTIALMHAARSADIIYAQNGPSVELPLILVSRAARASLFMHIGDTAAHAYAATRPLRRCVERLALRRARVVEGAPAARPEILPFAPRPEEALAAWEESWHAHVRELEHIFTHAQ